MTHRRIDIVDEFTMLKKENDRLKKRLDRIEVLFNQAQNLVELVKIEVTDIKRNVETMESEMKNGKLV
jgi:predicted  nucleic acid-binding Zn-ribbon protein